MLLILLFGFLTITNIVHSQSENDILGGMETFGKIMNLMPLLEQILVQNATSLCQEHIKEYINGLASKSIWALRMLDSNAKLPEGLYKGNTKFFGFYEECISTEHPRKLFTGKHCLVRLGNQSESFAERLLKQEMKRINNFYDAFKEFLDLLFGMCFPSTCSASEMEVILTNITESISPNFTTIVIAEAACNTKEPREIPSRVWIVVGILLGFVVITVLSTAYDFHRERNGLKPDPVLASFSIISNTRLLLSEVDNVDEVKPLHGIRAITMGWIIFSHTVLFTIIGPAMNIVDVAAMIKNIHYVPVVNSFLAVDTFFFLSGFLVYLTFHRCIVQRGSYDVPMAFIHRYIRLTPPFAVVLLIQGTLFRYFGDGPIWNVVADEIESDCSATWWKSLLYVQNYMTPISPCAGQAWYISADMQMYWVSPIILYSLLCWPGFGAVLIVFLLLASSLTSFITIYLNDFGPTILLTSSLIEHFRYEYARMNTRAAPWLIGAALSYMIFYIEDRKIQVKISNFWATIGWITAIGISVGSMYGVRAFTDFDYTTLESAFYVPLHRIGWTLGLAWIVFACYYGYGGFVNSILSAKIFVPIGRLSYCAYLVHLALMLYRLANSKTAYYMDVKQFIYFYIGDLIISHGLAIVLKLMFEMPFSIIDKCLLGHIVLLPFPRKKKSNVMSEDSKKEISNSSTDTENGEVNRGFEYCSERL